VITEGFPNLQSAAFAVADPEWGQAIHLAIVGGDGSFEQQIQDRLVNQIGVASKIKGFHYLEELPLIGIGKVDRAALGGLVQ
jgi:O-succinylbenzoic acid--CoA ligase